MRRYSLREIALVAALLTVGFAWWLDHCQLQAVIVKATPAAVLPVAAAPLHVASSASLAVSFELPVLEQPQQSPPPETPVQPVAHVDAPPRGPFIELDTFVPDFQFFAPGEEEAPATFPGERRFCDCLGSLEKTPLPKTPAAASPTELDFDLLSKRDSFSPLLGSE